MNLRHLRFFCAVVDSRGVTRAAKGLHVSQPALSAGIKALEDELGHRLLERSAGGRHLRPTEKGRVLYAFATDILQRCESARKTLSSETVSTKSVRAGILTTIAAGEAASVTGELERQTLAWQWRFREGSTSQLADWLRRGHIDTAWTIVNEESSNARILWREPYVVLISRNHRLARKSGSRLTAQKLAKERLILRAGCEMPPGVLESAGLSPRATIHTHRDDLALRLVALGVGIAIGPRSFASGEIAPIRLPELTEARSIGLRWRPNVPSEAIDALIRAIGTVRTLREDGRDGESSAR